MKPNESEKQWHIFWLEQNEDPQQADTQSPLQELRELIITAFEVLQLPYEPSPWQSLQGQGLHYVHLDTGQEVLLQFEVLQEDHRCRVQARVTIDGQPSSMKEVVRLYSHLRNE